MMEYEEKVDQLNKQLADFSSENDSLKRLNRGNDNTIQELRR